MSGPGSGANLKFDGYVCVCVCVQPGVSLGARVPSSSQGRVDDHVHWNQVGHCVVGRPHRTQDSLPSVQGAGGSRDGMTTLLQSHLSHLLNRIEFLCSFSLHHVVENTFGMRFVF